MIVTVIMVMRQFACVTFAVNLDGYAAMQVFDILDRCDLVARRGESGGMPLCITLLRIGSQRDRVTTFNGKFDLLLSDTLCVFGMSIENVNDQLSSILVQNDLRVEEVIAKFDQVSAVRCLVVMLVFFMRMCFRLFDSLIRYRRVAASVSASRQDQKTSQSEQCERRRHKPQMGRKVMNQHGTPS